MKKRQIGKQLDIATLAPAFFLLVLVIVYSIFAKNFMTAGNLLNILRQVSITGIMAIGVTMVILLGEIDLSIGTVMAFCGMMAGGLATGKYFGLSPLPVGAAIAITLLLGALIGVISGLACAWLKIPGFMATLAMQYICEGLMLMITKAKPISNLPKRLTYWGSGYFLSIPVIIFAFLIVFIVGLILLRYSVFGRNLYAIGGSLEASRMSGIHVVKNKVLAFTICSALCALAGILMVGRIGSAQVTAGDSLQMQPIAAAVLGGASQMGGKGTMIGTLLGVLLMGVLVNGLNLMNVGSDAQKLVTGIVLFAAVAFNIWSSKKDK
ncbi:MAG: ABC transporter permease [Oscillibacter sp.]|nr:ABC transporter permease [Oscillibacter sp.]